jgi:hypothetical protein
MARELGLNRAKPGKLDNHEQEPCKVPLRKYIRHLYLHPLESHEVVGLPHG